MKKETKGVFIEHYEVVEMPMQARNKIRMELAELERFCQKNNMPLFKLKVEQIVNQGVSVPCTPYMKYFTVASDWMFWAAEPIEEKGAQA